MIRTNYSPYADEMKEGSLIVPEPNYVINEGDVMVLFGADDKINLITRK